MVIPYMAGSVKIEIRFGQLCEVTSQVKWSGYLLLAKNPSFPTSINPWSFAFPIIEAFH